MENDKMTIIKEDEWKSERNYYCPVITRIKWIYEGEFSNEPIHSVEVTELPSFMVNKWKSPIFIDLPNITIPFRSFTCYQFDCHSEW